MEVDMKEPDMAKVGSGEPKTLEAAGLSKDDQTVRAAMEVKLEKVED